MNRNINIWLALFPMLLLLTNNIRCSNNGTSMTTDDGSNHLINFNLTSSKQSKNVSLAFENIEDRIRRQGYVIQASNEFRPDTVYCITMAVSKKALTFEADKPLRKQIWQDPIKERCRPGTSAWKITVVDPLTPDLVYIQYNANDLYLSDIGKEITPIHNIGLVEKTKATQWKMIPRIRDNKPIEFYFKNSKLDFVLNIRGGFGNRGNKDLIDYTNKKKYHDNERFVIYVLSSAAAKSSIDFKSTNQVKKARKDYDLPGYKLINGQDVFDEGIYCFMLKSTNKQIAVAPEQDENSVVAGNNDCGPDNRFSIMRVRNNVDRFRIRSTHRIGDLGLTKSETGDINLTLQDIEANNERQHWAITEASPGYVYITNVGTGTRLGQNRGLKIQSQFRVWNANSDLDIQRFEVKLHSKVDKLSKDQMDKSIRIREKEATSKSTKADDDFFFKDDEKEGEHALFDEAQAYCIAPANLGTLSSGVDCLFDTHFMIKKQSGNQYIIQSTNNKYLDYDTVAKNVVLGDKNTETLHWKVSQNNNGTFRMLVKQGGDQLVYVTASLGGSKYNVGVTSDPDSNNESEFIFVKRPSFNPTINQKMLYCVRPAPMDGKSYALRLNENSNDLGLDVEGDCSEKHLWRIIASNTVKEGYYFVSAANHRALTESRTGIAIGESNKYLSRQVWVLTSNKNNAYYTMTNSKTKNMLIIMNEKNKISLHQEAQVKGVKQRSFEINPVACPSAKTA